MYLIFLKIHNFFYLISIKLDVTKYKLFLNWIPPRKKAEDLVLVALEVTLSKVNEGTVM